MQDKEKAARSNNTVYRDIAKYTRDYPIKGANDVQIVVDYISGMTDSYATACYEKIYWI